MRHLIDREGPFLHTNDAIEDAIVSLGRTIFFACVHCSHKNTSICEEQWEIHQKKRRPYARLDIGRRKARRMCATAHIGESHKSNKIRTRCRY